MENILAEYNKFWQNNNYRSNLVKRPYYQNQLSLLLERREIVSVTGIRRSGKSSILKLCIDALLDRGVHGKNIFSINLEDFRFGVNRDTDFLENIYQEYIKLNKPVGKVYLFLDEIQTINNFERWLRTYYDKEKHLKIIISGSSSALLTGELATLITGRHISLTVFPLTFLEYFSYKKPNYLKLFKEKGAHHFYLSRQNKELVVFVYKFLLTGGFPEILFGRVEAKELQLQQYLTDILFKDISKRYTIKNLDLLQKLLHYLISNNSNEISVNRIAKILGSSRATISQLINYYKQVFLLYTTTLFSYSANERLQVKKPQKIYCVDTGLFFAVKQTAQEDLSKMAENIVFLQLKNTWEKEVFYWKSKIEIDFIIDNGFPINVTYTDSIPEREWEGLFYYLRVKNIPRGMLITKNVLDKKEEAGKIIDYVPLWMFLLAESPEALKSRLKY